MAHIHYRIFTELLIHAEWDEKASGAGVPPSSVGLVEEDIVGIWDLREQDDAVTHPDVVVRAHFACDALKL